MRVVLSVNVPGKVIPFDHQNLLAGTVYKWLGHNGDHGKVSLYSFSRLQGGRDTEKNLRFENGASFFFSAHEPDVVKRLISGVRTDKSLFYGLEVTEIQLINDPDLTQQDLYYPCSPILIKRRNGERVNHILYDNPMAGEYLKETLNTKMKEAGLEDDTLEVSFETSYQRAGRKMVNYNGTMNRCSWCPVKIKGQPETKLFAWNVGLGNSTGIGLGAIM